MRLVPSIKPRVFAPATWMAWKAMRSHNAYNCACVSSLREDTGQREHRAQMKEIFEGKRVARHSHPCVFMLNASVACTLSQQLRLK
jgi:hypothetical protein